MDGPVAKAFEYGTTAAVLVWLMFYVTKRLDKIIELLLKLIPAISALAKSNDKVLDRLDRGRGTRETTDVTHLDTLDDL